MQTFKKIGLGALGLGVLAISTLSLSGCFGVSSSTGAFAYKTDVTIGGNNGFGYTELSYDSANNGHLLDESDKKVTIDTARYNTLIGKEPTDLTADEKTEMTALGKKINAFQLNSSITKNLTSVLSSHILPFVSGDLGSKDSYTGFSQALTKMTDQNRARHLNEFAIAYHISGGIGKTTYILSPSALSYDLNYTPTKHLDNGTKVIEATDIVPATPEGEEAKKYTDELKLTNIKLTYSWYKANEKSMSKVGSNGLSTLQKTVEKSGFWTKSTNFLGEKVTKPTTLDYTINFGDINYLVEYAKGYVTRKDGDDKKETNIFSGLLNFATYPTEHDGDNIENSSFKFIGVSSTLAAQNSRIIFEQLDDYRNSLNQSPSIRKEFADEILKLSNNFYSTIFKLA